MPLCAWRYGHRTYTEVRVATAKAVDDNYAVGIASDTLILPADQAWNTNEATTRSDFVATFVGIADQVKAAGVARVPGNSEDNIIRVVSGPDVYDFPVESNTFVVGDYIGPSKDTGNALKNNMFKKVSSAAEGIARVVRSSAGVAVTTVRAMVLSTLNPVSK